MHVVILGNGVSGITAARYVRKLSDHQITVISAESDYFFSRTALMYIYMGHMRLEDTQPYENWFWEKNRIELKKAWIESVDFSAKALKTAEGETVSYDKLVLAVGSKPNKFGWPGQDLKRVGGLYTLQDLSAMETATQDGIQQAVIVGGGLIGIEMAEMFHSRHIPVTMLVREESYWDNVLPAEESAMINRHIKEHGIDLRLKGELKEIIDDGQGNACAVITKEGERIECQYVGLTAGVSPNTAFLKNSDLEIGRGILIDQHLQTNIPDVYAIGDCAELHDPQAGRKSIEAVWYTGKMMGEVAAYNICGQKTAYDPGTWFNSAKFLDIEYQVYGDVQANPPENQQALYWEHKDGKKSIRIVYDQSSKEVLGFNLMGVRYRHEVCEKWIEEKTNVETVLKNLKLANFDPEFYKTFEAAVVNKYNQQSGAKLQVQKKRSLKSVLQFLGA
jgi:NADPH-dependent 2,4-dienoyl-CoA reductase/sulfur reductase-like enzyme